MKYFESDKCYNVFDEHFVWEPNSFGLFVVEAFATKEDNLVYSFKKIIFKT